MGFGYILKINNSTNILNVEGTYDNDKEYVIYKINIENPIVCVNGSHILTRNEIFKINIVDYVLSISNVTAEFICDGLTSMNTAKISKDVFVNHRPGRFTKSAKI